MIRSRRNHGPDELRKALQCKVISLRVLDHQDDERDNDDLTGSEQLKVLADHRTTAAL
jgi:hypothetical protein